MFFSPHPMPSPALSLWNGFLSSFFLSTSISPLDQARLLFFAQIAKRYPIFFNSLIDLNRMAKFVSNLIAIFFSSVPSIELSSFPPH